MRLVLFTTSYPYNASLEQPFIERELPYLAKYFSEIILIPQVCGEKIFTAPIPVKVEEGLCRSININKKSLMGKIINVILSRAFYNEVISRPLIMLSFPKFLGLVTFITQAEVIRRWTEGWIRQSGISIDDTLFYTYWFAQGTMGLGMVKRKIPRLKLVSRAHGYDVYEERVLPSYWPCRPQVLAALDKLFLASDHAKEYMTVHYPKFSHLYETAHLGVQDPKHITRQSEDGIFRIVSCSSIVPVKRVALLLKAIARAAELYPNQTFEWRHFGDGQEKAQLRETARIILPPNAQCVFVGYKSNDSLMRYYKEFPVDVFINVSESEGGAPVSIQEAISYGIPVIATNVGGNPEIVSDQNGILLGPNPSPGEVAQALLTLLNDSQATETKKKGSRSVWQKRYNAENNFQAFALELYTICLKNQ